MATDKPATPPAMNKTTESGTPTPSANEAALRSGENAPNAPSAGTTNLGGKTDWNKTDGGTQQDPSKEQTDEEKSKGDTQKLVERMSRSDASVASPTQEEMEKGQKGLVYKEEEVDGKTVLRSSVSEDDLAKHSELQGTLPTATTLTQSLTGVTGQMDLTQGGQLNSDKSKRSSESLEDQVKEMDLAAGANPTPNRDGNERLRAELGFTPNMLLGIDQQTSGMADRLAKLREKGSLSEEDKQELERIESQLRLTART